MPVTQNSIVLAVLVILSAIAICVLIYYTSRQHTGQCETWPYSAKAPLTEVEKKLYFRLREALPDHIILAQVSLYGVLNVESKAEHMKYFNKISRKSLDFVVCDDDFNVITVIELDDKTHELPDRIKADYEKDTALKSAGVNIIRWQVKKFPTQATIRKDVLGIKKQKPASRS